MADGTSGCSGNSDIRIRPMKIDDYEGVLRLWLDTPGLGLRSLDDSRDGIARYLARNPETCFVAEQVPEIQDTIVGRPCEAAAGLGSCGSACEGLAVAGVILSGHDGRRGYIYHMGVAAGFRRRGIGKALVDAALLALKAQAITKVALVAFAGNESGNAFWEAEGFEARTDLIYRNRSLLDQPDQALKPGCSC